MKKILLVVFVALMSVQMGSAQEVELKDSPIDFHVDIKSDHLWRGLVITDQPMVAVFSKLSLNVYEVLKSIKCVDVFLS